MTQMTQISKSILITGASGNLGHKLWNHLEHSHDLRLIDKKAVSSEVTTPKVVEADLAIWDDGWAQHFRGIETVVHLAANPNASAPWEQITEPNIDALINVYTAATQAGVARIIYASSNHAMGGYKDIPEPTTITTDIPAKPGTIYSFDGKSNHNSLAYGGAKYFGERLGKCYYDIYGLSTIAVRIGWNLHDEKRPERDKDPWFQQMWISNRDFCHLMYCCIEADPGIGFAVVNGMSNNSGMRWDLSHAKDLIGYEPQDDIAQWNK